VRAVTSHIPDTQLSSLDQGYARRDEINVAIVGFGTVGSSVARILSERPPPRVRLTHIFNRNIERKRVGWVDETVSWTEDIENILSSSAHVVVELIGGLEPAGSWIRQALAAGKSVVTANKQLIARDGAELVELARAKEQQILFGASVAGGVPVISGLQEGLAGDELIQLCGILNGTCNYILSRIESARIAFPEALAEAQKLGFAEADPSEDVDGLDARAKLAILVRAGLRIAAEPADVAVKSIRALAPVDFEYAKLLGATIRQISRAEKSTDCLYASVEPALVPTSSPLAAVDGPQNLVMSTGKYGGETIFAGHGAGGNATAVAIVSDLVSIARSRLGKLGKLRESPRTTRVSADFTTRHYLRFFVRDQPGIIAALAQVLARHAINIDAVFQKPGYSKSKLPFVITLEPCPASTLQRALEEIAPMNFLVEPCLHLPILQ
jgi:homoserine dehydrogenase